MDSRDFLQEQQRAIERMREMSRRSTADTAHTMPPAPAFVKVLPFIGKEGKVIYCNTE